MRRTSGVDELTCLRCGVRLRATGEGVAPRVVSSRDPASLLRRGISLAICRLPAENLVQPAAFIRAVVGGALNVVGGAADTAKRRCGGLWRRRSTAMVLRNGSAWSPIWIICSSCQRCVVPRCTSEPPRATALRPQCSNRCRLASLLSRSTTDGVQRASSRPNRRPGRSGRRSRAGTGGSDLDRRDAASFGGSRRHESGACAPDRLTPMAPMPVDCDIDRNERSPHRQTR
jgi:hypothetical protein